MCVWECPLAKKEVEVIEWVCGSKSRSEIACGLNFKSTSEGKTITVREWICLPLLWLALMLALFFSLCIANCRLIFCPLPTATIREKKDTDDCIFGPFLLTALLIIDSTTFEDSLTRRCFQLVFLVFLGWLPCLAAWLNQIVKLYKIELCCPVQSRMLIISYYFQCWWQSVLIKSSTCATIIQSLQKKKCIMGSKRAVRLMNTEMLFASIAPRHNITTKCQVCV